MCLLVCCWSLVRICSLASSAVVAAGRGMQLRRYGKLKSSLDIERKSGHQASAGFFCLSRVAWRARRGCRFGLASAQISAALQPFRLATTATACSIAITASALMTMTALGVGTAATSAGESCALHRPRLRVGLFLCAVAPASRVASKTTRPSSQCARPVPWVGARPGYMVSI